MHCQSEKKNKLLKLKLKSNQDPKIAQPQSEQNWIGPTSFEVSLNLADTVCHCFWQSQWRNRSAHITSCYAKSKNGQSHNKHNPPLQILVCVCKYTPHTLTHTDSRPQSRTYTYICYREVSQASHMIMANVFTLLLLGEELNPYAVKRNDIWLLWSSVCPRLG